MGLVFLVGWFVIPLWLLGSALTAPRRGRIAIAARAVAVIVFVMDVLDFYVLHDVKLFGVVVFIGVVASVVLWVLAWALHRPDDGPRHARRRRDGRRARQQSVAHRRSARSC